MIGCLGPVTDSVSCCNFRGRIAPWDLCDDDSILIPKTKESEHHNLLPSLTEGTPAEKGCTAPPSVCSGLCLPLPVNATSDSVPDDDKPSQMSLQTIGHDL